MKNKFEKFKDKQFKIYLKKVEEISKEKNKVKTLIASLELLGKENLKLRIKIKKLEKENKYLAKDTGTHYSD